MHDPDPLIHNEGFASYIWIIHSSENCSRSTKEFI